jgi:NAD(P)H-dependent FMN reductase
MGLNFLVIYGSVRCQRAGIRAARYITNRCIERGHTATLIDPLEYPLPLLDKMYKEYVDEPAPELLQKLASLIVASDAVIVVTGEYNHSIPPALTNILDHFLEEWFWRPSAIVSYSGGSFGGVRAAVQLRAMLAELGMPSIPSEMPVPRVASAFDEEGKPSDVAWDKRSGRFLDELTWYATALKEMRAKGVPY